MKAFFWTLKRHEGEVMGSSRTYRLTFTLFFLLQTYLMEGYGNNYNSITISFHSSAPFLSWPEVQSKELLWMACPLTETLGSSFPGCCGGDLGVLFGWFSLSLFAEDKLLLFLTSDLHICSNGWHVLTRSKRNLCSPSATDEKNSIWEFFTPSSSFDIK